MKNLITLAFLLLACIQAVAQENQKNKNNMKTPNTVKSIARPAPENQKVRLSRITVDPARLTEYNAYLKEEIETSMRLEAGVLPLYAVAEKDNPAQITILEIYADEAAYRSHIETSHFRKYKEGTLDMVKDLELIDTTPLIPELKIK